ncbi:O-methyltransferase [Flavisolibacter ginsenosidimutans]|uniref:O-methyltransferase n=1 Tax=Flavisolibacter ginsenosidimutans TaxID=661481 RepID=A0A5B8UKH4_9BACT|nr:O-methyltransferase [Flavisolibacter ginsenosidimutans]QEC56515.1 O-methyltransferase [Flavisolibacter ginsenosidimutans]
MDIVHPQAQAYAEKYTSPEDALLHEVAQYTYTQHAHSHMLSGHLQGKFLEMISCMIKPQRILEIGTFTGYSALCLAKGLQPGGKLHTVELREDDAARAQEYFRRSSYAGQIILHIGNALEIVGELDEAWDLVFIDADKENYTAYFNLVFPFVKPGGFILADNVLFHGQVLEAEIKGKNAKAIQAFNDEVAKRIDAERMLLPLRDGIFLIRKLHE